MERSQRLGSRMAVVVVSADRDHRDSRPEHAQLVGEAGVGRAVMRDLEHLDLPQRQRTRDLRLGVAGEQQVDRAVAREHDGAVKMRILVGRARVVGPENAEPEPPERGTSCPARAGTSGTPRPRAVDRSRPLVEARARLHRVDHRADRQRPQDGRRAADVIAVRVRDHDRGERVEPHPPQLPVDARLGRAGIDEHRALRRLEQDPVALADVEERDPQPGRRRPRSAADAAPTSRARRASTSATAVTTTARRR